MTKTLRPFLALLLLPVVVMLAMPAEASVNAFWKELGGSATGKAVSQLTPPPGLGNGVAVAAGADGKPIVVYTVSPIGEEGTLLAKRWTGTAWQLISPVTGINDPSIGGENPQIVISPAGTIFVGWNTREVGGGQIHLRRRTATGTVWEQLAGSDAPGGLTSLNGSNVTNFSLAVGDDDLPVVAFEAPARKPGLGGLSTEISTGSAQVYVKKYMGAAQGWQYLGPDPLGTGNTSAGGASGALSFIVAGGIYASHSAVNPSLVIDSEGRPTVAFIYQTNYFSPPGPPEFVAGNTEIFVTRFDNGVWGPVGPAVPTGDTVAGRGGAGGVSSNTGFSGEPSLAAASNGTLWMAWRESQPMLTGAIFVRRWNGVDTWEEVGGASASGGGINGGDGGYGPLVGLDQDELPIVAWQDLSSKHVAFVLRFNGTEWEEMGPDSASDDGVTGDSLYRLALGVSSGSPSTVNVAWLGSPIGTTAQARLRQFFNGPSFLLSVGIIPGGSGQVTSSPIGINCPADSCSEFYPTGTVVSLAATPGPDTLFDKWTGACTGSLGCLVTMAGARAVNASFVSAATLAVAKTGQGTVTGTGIACGADCEQKYRSGTLVTLTATMPAGTIFDGWGGACAFRGKNTSCPLTVLSNTSVTAGFSQRLYTLGVTVGTPPGTVGQGGVGSIDGSGGGADPIACGFGGSGACSALVEHGTRVVLGATAAAGNRFLNWLGVPCAGRANATCDFPMVANYSTTALFRGVTAISVNKNGNGTGTITGPLGNCGTECVGEAFTNTSVIFKAVPAVSSVIEPNGGVCTWTAGSCTYTATGLNQTLLATFTLRRFVLNVTGEGFGYTTSADGGIDCGSVPNHFDCTQTYDYGTVVALTPFAGTDSLFTSWTGCSRLNGSTCFVDMTANRTVHKKFIPAQTLDLSASGNGHGRYLVPGKPPVLCTGCAASFILPYSTTASTLVTATPDIGSNFQWVSSPVASCVGKSTPCSVIMSANRSLVGTFTLNRHSLTVTNRLNGSVVGTFAAPDPYDVLCGSGDSQCTTVQNYGTPVQLTAAPDVGNVFVNWTGTSPCSVGAQATNPICSFPLKGNVTTTPNFRARTLVTVLKAGNGSGTITGPGISCGTDCSQAEFDSKLITLTAAPAVGSRFVGFTGDCVSGISTCPFIPSGNNQTVTGTFALRQFQLTVSNVTGGYVSNPGFLGDDIVCGRLGTDCTSTLDYNTPVTLTAYPDDEYVFVKWLGTVCASSTNPDCTFKMPLGNVSLTPVYRLRTTVIVMKDGLGKGVVTSTPPALNCPVTQSQCQADFFDGTLVTLRATPATGSRFLGFSDQCTSTNSTCAFTPAGPTQFVHAEFELLKFTLNVTSRNQGVVNSFPGSINCGVGGATPCSEMFDYGTSLQLFAYPEPGYLFVNWTGVTCTGGNTNDTCAFTLTANTTATPNYRRRTVVQVQRDGDGTGTVTGTGIACGADCQETIFDGKTLALTATAAVGSRFMAWSAPCAGSNASVCTFTPVGDQQIVTANFDRQPVPLTINVNGPGTVNGIAPPCPASSSCGYTKFYGDQLVLQPAADTNARFISWTGCTSVSGANCTVLMNASKTVTATFQPEFTLTVTPSGNATGTVTGTGINCGADCSETYLTGTVVTLTRSAPATGVSFQWLGDCAFRGTNSTCMLTMNQNHSVGAQFQLQQFTVTVNKTGTAQGRVLGLGVPCDLAQATCSNTFDYGTAVSLAADVTGTGSVFDGWGGSCSGTGSCNLSVTTNRTVTAAFSPMPAASVTVGPSGQLTFVASTVTITAGQTVRWQWGSPNHNVVSGSSGVADNQFCSPGDTGCATTLLSGTGTVYSHTFTTPGTFPYFCRAHRLSGMTGTITVLPPE